MIVKMVDVDTVQICTLQIMIKNGLCEIDPKWDSGIKEQRKPLFTRGILWLTLFTSKCDKPGVVKQTFTDQEVVDVPLSELRKSE